MAAKSPRFRRRANTSSASTMRVRVALLGEEALAVRGVLLIERVAGDDRIEVRRAAHPASAAAPVRAAAPPPAATRTSRTWIATAASGRSIEKLATLLTTRPAHSPRAKRVVQPLALLRCVDP